MKNFKSYMIEAAGDGKRRENPVVVAYSNLSDTLEDLYGKNKIANPNREGETIGLTRPIFNIMEGGKVIDGHQFGGKLNRRYVWNTWKDGLSALSTSMVGTHHALGTLTGNHHGRDLSLEEIDSNHNLVLSKFSPAVESFKGQHQLFLEDLQIFHPEIRKNLDVLHKAGHIMEQINNGLFHDALNRKLVKHQMELAKRFGNQTGKIHDELQHFLTKENNQAVATHSHPLGLMLSGGIPALSGNQSQKPTIKEPHPTDRYSWVDISHKYEM